VTSERPEKARNGPNRQTPIRQEAVATALAAGHTRANAARKCGVGETTIKRWQKQPAFMARVAELRAELTDRTLGLLARASGKAVVTLVASLNDESTGNRIKASDVLLTHDAKAREAAELKQQLADIQEQLGQLEGSKGKGRAK